MDRRQIRLRREYLYQKEKEREEVKNKDQTVDKQESKDCEYSDFNGLPNLLLTTSRDPSSRLKQFQKELSLLFGSATVINRGAYKVKDLYDLGIKNGFTDIVIVHENRGEPDGLIVSHLPVGPTLFFGLGNTVLRHDAKGMKGTISGSIPNLIFHNFNEEKIGRRLKMALQHLFSVNPIETSKRVVTFAASNEHISVRHHGYKKSDHIDIDVEELGPRFELRPYMIKLGNLLQSNSTIEWSLKTHINTSKKNKHISLE